ncbi:unnamed protein product [Lactuca saligna]|uniref:DUF4283 domain-containing protein n=1 Tax=Lactuca saligna TaxID=75948 RepID=A0AA35VQ77_LACSI|nr:unnamed protein product [Lactuca saligna]
MGKIHRVHRSSRKKSKYHDAEAAILGSFHFEDSPQKDEVVAGSRNIHGESEFVESSSSSTAFCISNHSNKGIFFSNSPVHVSHEASCEPSVEKIDCYSHDNEEVEGPGNVFGEESVPINPFADSFNDSQEAVESEDVPHAKDGASKKIEKIDGIVEDCSDSDDEDLVRDLPSTGFLSPVVSSPTPPSGSASVELPSLPILTAEKHDDEVNSPRSPIDGAVDAFGCLTAPLNLRSPPSSVVSSILGKDLLPVEGRTPNLSCSIMGKEILLNKERSDATGTSLKPINCSSGKALIAPEIVDSPIPNTYSKQPLVGNMESQKMPCLGTKAVGHDLNSFLGDTASTHIYYPPKIKTQHLLVQTPPFPLLPLSFADIVLGKSKTSLAGPLSPDHVVDDPTCKDSPIKFSDDEVPSVTPLKLDFVNISNSLHDDFLIIPPEIMTNGSIPFERTLYGYFIGNRLAFPLVKDSLQELWKEHGISDIFIDDMFFFKFDNENGMNYVLQKGIWKINGIPLFLRKWDPDVFIEKPTYDRVPVWVNIFGIPLQLFNKDGLSLIASKLGNPLEVDSYTTTMCERATGRAVFARILIEMSAKDPWAKEIKIKAVTAKGATSTTLRVEYSWNPKRCDYCKIFGHDHATCPDHSISAPDPKSATPTPKDVDNEGYQTVMRRSRNFPIPKKKIPIDNRKGKGHAIKITQVYKPVTRVEPKKKVSTNMFDALSHQRVDDIDDDSRVPQVIHSSTTIPASNALPSSSHGGCTSSPIDQG